MKVSSFAKRVTILEGKKKSISIAQVLEVLKIVNKITNGELYRFIRSL